VAFQELRDDHRVMKHGVRAQFVIPFERHHEAGQILAGDGVDRAAVAKELTEAIQNRFVLAMRVGLLERVDLLQVLCDGGMERGFLIVSPAVSNPGMPSLRPSSSWRLRRCASSACAVVTPAPARRRVPPEYHSM